jgi:hypothetical protein
MTGNVEPALRQVNEMKSPSRAVIRFWQQRKFGMEVVFNQKLKLSLWALKAAMPIG